MDKQLEKISMEKSCFSLGSVPLEVLITISKIFFNVYFIKVSNDFTAERHVNHYLKGDACTVILTGLLPTKKE